MPDLSDFQLLEGAKHPVATVFVADSTDSRRVMVNLSVPQFTTLAGHLLWTEADNTILDSIWEAIDDIAAILDPDYTKPFAR